MLPRQQSRIWNAFIAGLVVLMAGCSAATPAGSLQPSRAPLAGQVVFFDNKTASSHAQIYIEHADGADLRHLVDSDFDDENPVLAADGRRVAFVRYLPDGSSQDFVVNVDGTGLKQIGKNGEDLSWSPDGTEVVETLPLFDPGEASPYNVGLWIVTVDTGAARQVTLKGVRCPDTCANGAQDNGGRFSPDGKRIAFVRDTYTKPEQFAIFTMAVDGSDLRRVTPVGMNAGDPHWSPDGERILFQSPTDPIAGQEQNIYTIRPDGTELTQLTRHLSTAGLQGAFHPSWSPDGRQILFSRFPGAQPERASLFVMNADGTDIHLLAPTTMDQNAAEWGPLPTSG